MPVRSFIEFQVAEGRSAEFERVYREGGFLERARIVPGFLGGDFVCVDREAGRYTTTALWDSFASYAHWQEIGPRETPRKWRKALLEVVTKFEPGIAGEVIDRVEAASDADD